MADQINGARVINQNLYDLPATSDSISLNNFMASITQRTVPSEIISPTSTNEGLSGPGFL